VSKTTGQQGFGAQPLPSVTSRIVTSEQRTSISSSVVALSEAKINTLKHGHHHIVKQFSLSPSTATASANIKDQRIRIYIPFPRDNLPTIFKHFVFY